MKRIKIGMTQEQKDKISKKNKEWSDSKTCPECGRRNAISLWIAFSVGGVVLLLSVINND